MPDGKQLLVSASEAGHSARLYLLDVTGGSPRPILRALVHRGGLRADVLEDGDFAIGDQVAATPTAAD